MILRWLIEQHRVIQLFFVLVLLCGYVSLLNLGREELPEPINEHDGMTITAKLPGASPDQIDSLIARPIHLAIKDIPGVKEVESEASEGRLLARVRFKAQERNTAALSREISQRVSQLTDFPDDIDGPYVTRFRSRIWEDMTLAFVGGDTLARHQQWRWVSDAVRSIPEVSELVVTGERERRIDIAVDGVRTAAMGSRIDHIARQITEALHQGAAGQQQSAKHLHQLRVKTHPASAQALDQITIRVGDSDQPLGMISEISETLEPARVFIDHNEGEASYIQLYREPGSNIETMAKGVRALADELNAGFEQDNLPFRLRVITDRSAQVVSSFSELRNSVALGIALVLLVLWLSVGLRSAFYAAIGIPFAFLASFIVMSWMGLNLNLLTLFGLILVCGMVVDDTIVVLENIIAHREKGAQGLTALSRGISEVSLPVIASTATTIASFFPLLLMTGDLGLFLSSIPKVVIIALLASLIECFIILPVHLYGVEKQRAPILQPLLLAAETGFTRLCGYLVQRPIKALLLFFCLLASTAWPLHSISFTLANGTEIRGLNLAIELPTTTSLQSTRKYLLQIQPDLEEMQVFSDIVLKSGWRHLQFSNEQQPWLGSLQLSLNEAQRSPERAHAIAEKVQKLLQSSLPVGSMVNLSLDQNKPPSDPPIVIKIFSSNDNHLRDANTFVQDTLLELDGVRNLNDPLRGGMQQRVFSVDHASARHYGLAPGDVTRLLHMAVTGLEVGQLDLADERVPIYVTGSQGTTTQHKALTHITNADGNALPLARLGRFTDTAVPSTYFRRNDLRYVQVLGEIDATRITQAELQQSITQLIASAPLPGGTRIEQGGDFAEISQSLQSMLFTTLLALGLCYIILTLVCRSYFQPFLLLACVPPALCGVLWGIWITDSPLSILGVAGIIGLIGIVLNDALVWIDFYNRQRRKNVAALPATLLTLQRRFRPIVLTSITTILALLPAAIQGAGVATEIARITVFGLCSASLSLLFFLPVLVLSYDKVVMTVSALRTSIQPLSRVIANASWIR